MSLRTNHCAAKCRSKKIYNNNKIKTNETLYLVEIGLLFNEYLYNLTENLYFIIFYYNGFILSL